ncbi:hypothetical protein R6Q57_004342 [Mikania cordata]
MDKDDEDHNKRVEWLHSKQYSAAGNIFKDPQKTTRIGDEYQAQIPSLITENDDQNNFEFGLSIPVTWVHNQENMEETMRFKANAKGKSGNVGCGTDNDLVPVPCSSCEESWSAIEHDSFILGLYVFGKNLRVVNKFMGNKGMQNVISYYYGKFYGSSEHQKWSIYRKKRISIGKKIFNGWRLHELLSRLLSNVTDECKASLTQVIRMFEAGKLSFEKYVFSLRDTMGVDLLVQAVAIGKGKQDLTIKTRTRLRSKKIQSTCSSLKTEEIVDILKDRIGLSKARLNEFFWAAVWPRLSARGWHSEQLNNYAFQKSKNIVFLAPGVTKFSRRSLIKGIHYFDSLTEVLNKVASEPHLVDHEPEKDQLVVPCVTHGSDDEHDLMKCAVVKTSLPRLVADRELTSLNSVFGETKHKTKESQKDVNHNTVDDSPASEAVNNVDPDEQPAKKMKLVVKQKTKHQQVKNTKNEKQNTRIVIDLNNPRVDPGSNDDSNSSSAKKLVSSKTTTNQDPDLLTCLANGQRQSRRNRALTTRAMEALANGFMNPKTKREPEDRTLRRVRAKTAPVSSCGPVYLVD